MVVGKRNYKGQGNASPFRRILMARGITLMQAAVYSDVSLEVLRKFDRMDVNVMGGIKIKSLLRVARFLEVAPTDLMPFLQVVAEKKKDQ
jgi:hypothetical protein